MLSKAVNVHATKNVKEKQTRLGMLQAEYLLNIPIRCLLPVHRRINTNSLLREDPDHSRSPYKITLVILKTMTWR